LPDHVETVLCPAEAHKYLHPLVSFEVEEFWAIALSSQKTVIARQMLFRGTVNWCQVHMRDIFRFAIRSNACGLLVAHTHPSGNTFASDSDILLTRNLLKVANLIEIELIDHIILTDSGFSSILQEISARRCQKNGSPASPRTRVGH
jgi:DNA repair protein RadC